MRFLLLSITLPVALAQFPPLSLPLPLGPHRVGTKYHYLPAPKTQSPPRDIMVSLFYPTDSAINSTTYPIAPAYDTPYATFLEYSIGLPPGLPGSLQSQAHLNAPLIQNPRGNGPRGVNDRKSKHPEIVIFSPGYGNSRLDYTATLSNVASRGYIVVGVDHPNDTAFITYPNGRTLISQSPPLNDSTAPAAVDVRVKDLKFVLDALSRTSNIIPGLKGALDVSKVLIFGHSLGGAAAASAIFCDRRFVAGANLDGSVWGKVVEKGLKDSPYLIIAAENHNSSNDQTWSQFWKRSRGGWEGELQVRGARHGSFSDFGVLYNILRALQLIPDLDPTGEMLGTIGERVLNVVDAYLTAFFQFALTGKKDKLLKGPSSEFPEVSFYPIGK